MIGSFLTRGLVMVFGYAYPAYECYKAVERNKPEVQKLRFWCQYWILVAILTVLERVADAFVSWVPMYSEAKLAFFIYLWYPRTRGTTYVYDSFFKPYVAKHEHEIDRNLLELRTRAGDMAVLYCQRAASYGQTRISEVLQFVAAQSTPKPQPPQRKQQKQAPIARQATAPSCQAASKLQPESKKPMISTASPSSSQHKKEDVEEKAGPAQTKAVPPLSPSNKPKEDSASENSSQSTANEVKAMRVRSLPSASGNKDEIPPSKESVIEETIRITRGRLRKARSAGTQ